MPLTTRLAATARGSRAAIAGFGVLAAFALILSACGVNTTGSTSGHTTTGAVPTSTVSCPSTATVASWHLVTSSQLTIASDTTYAPAEYPDPQNPTHYIGYDMDIARELARRLCLQPNIVKTTFDSIIPDIAGAPLGQQRYDLSISSFTINDKRQQVVNMIPYFTAGESILTTPANAGTIKSIADMCGKTIAVQNGTVEQQELEDANGGSNGSGQAPICQQANKPITLVANDDQGFVVNQVLNGRADASYQDQPVTDYYASLHKGQLVDSGITVQPSPEGIVVRKDNPALQTAITDALNNMRADGTYLRILTAWGEQSLAYPPLS